MAQNPILIEFIDQEVPVDAPDGSKMVKSVNVNNAVKATAQAMGFQTPPLGGAINDVLMKAGPEDYNFKWGQIILPPNIVFTFNGRTGTVMPEAGDYDKTMIGLPNVDNTADANKPVSGPQQAALDQKINLSEKGAASGVATLGADSKIPTSQIPAIVLGETFTVGSQAEMLALPANMGDVAIRTDQGGNKYLLLGEPASVASNWSPMGVTGPVISVNGQTGIVLLAKGDIGLGNVDNTSDANKPVSTAQAAADNLRILLTEKGAALGVATLDGTGKVPSGQLPAMNYIPTSEKGQPSGVATLDTGGKVPATQLPFTSGSFIQNQNAAAQTASFWITGQGRLGSAAIDAGTLTLAPATSDFPAANGAMFYRSDTHSFRVCANGLWKDIPLGGSSVVSGSTIYVDQYNPNATDTRTGLSKYSLSTPFLTINAAASASAGGDTIQVAAGTYTENVSAPGPLSFILAADCLINGTLTATTYGLSIIGLGYVTPDIAQTTGIARITGVTAYGVPLVSSGSGAQHAGSLYLANISIQNTGDGVGVFSDMSLTGASYVDKCRIVCKGSCAQYSGSAAGPLLFYRSYASSSGDITLVGNGVYVTESTVVNTAPAGGAVCMSSGPSTMNYQAFRSKLYCANGPIMNGNNIHKVPFRFNDNLCNTLGMAFELYSEQAGDTAPEGVEICRNTFNARGAGTDAFAIHFRRDTRTIPAVVVDNRYNAASFVCIVNIVSPVPNVVSGNVGSIAFPNFYPTIP